jgi:hypothetical protein
MSKTTVQKLNYVTELKRLAKGQKTRSCGGDPQWVAQWALPLVEYALAQLEEERIAETGVTELERMFKLEDPRS